MSKTFNWESFYNQNWATIYSKFFSQEESKKEIDLIVKIAFIRKNDQILDLCCGLGRHAIELAKRGYKVTGFDYSLPFLRNARKKAKKANVSVDFLQGDIRDLPYLGEFDVILMFFSALFYFEKETAQKILYQVAKMLKPDGRLILVTTDEEELINDYRKRGKKIAGLNKSKIIEKERKFAGFNVTCQKEIDFGKSFEKINFEITNKNGQKDKRSLKFYYHTSKQIENLFRYLNLNMTKILRSAKLNFFSKSLERSVIFVGQKGFLAENKKENIPRVIGEIQKIREKRWQIKSSVEIAFLLANLKKQTNILDYLDKIWLVKKEDLSEGALTIDFVEFFERFNKKQKLEILKNIYALELTLGCTSGCFFCAYGIKKKIEKKFSFKSIKKFYKKYGRFIPKRRDFFEEIRWKLVSRFYHQYEFFPFDIPSDNNVLLYWNGDPFLYQDGNYIFFDVYKLTVASFTSRFSRYLSTSLAPGSLKNFIIFFEKIIKVYSSKGLIRWPLIRISLTKHNVQRVEATLLFMYYYLISKGFLSQKINELYDKLITFHIRDEKNIFPVGPLIKEGNQLIDIISPQCKDGVILSPGDSRVQTMVAANDYDPSGALTFNLKGNSIIPKHMSLMNFAYHLDIRPKKKDHLKQIKRLIIQKKVFLPLAKIDSNDKVFGGLFKGGSPEYLFVVLSRTVLSLRHFIGFSSQLDISDVPEEIKKEYLTIALKDFYKFRAEFIPYFNKAKEKLDKKPVNLKKSDSYQKLKYIFSLTITYLNFLDFLMGFIKRNTNVNLIITLFKFFLKLQYKDIKKIDFLIRNLTSLLRLKINESSLILLLNNISEDQIICFRKVVTNFKFLFSERFINLLLEENKKNKLVKKEFSFSKIYSLIEKNVMEKVGHFWQFKGPDRKKTLWLDQLTEIIFIEFINSWVGRSRKKS